MNQNLRHVDICKKIEKQRFHCHQNAFHVQKEIYEMVPSELSNNFLPDFESKIREKHKVEFIVYLLGTVLVYTRKSWDGTDWIVQILKSIIRILFNNKCELEVETNKKKSRGWKEREWQRVTDWVERYYNLWIQQVSCWFSLIFWSSWLWRVRSMWEHPGTSPKVDYIYTVFWNTGDHVQSSDGRHSVSHRPRPWNTYSPAKWKSATNLLF